MSAGAGVLGSVTIGRTVATSRATTFLAGPQMHPAGADLHAFLALTAFRGPYGLDRAKMGAGSRWHLSLSYSCCRSRCTKEIAIDPSPTAEATRLTLPLRTSPTAKTPGRLVSNKYGVRASGQCAAASSSRERSGPVLINPFSSSATQRFSHAVLGIAPAMTKTCLMLAASMCPV